jgi:hypothetical protein
MRSIYGRVAVIAALMVVPLAACRQKDPTTSPRTDRSLLTRDQWGDHRFNTAYEAVEALRSNWMNTRGPDSFRNPSVVRVYLDNVSLGDKEMLKTVMLTNIVYIRFYDGISATSRWGLDHGAGVIYVSTRPLGSDPQS